MSHSRKFQPLATSTPNSKCTTQSAVSEVAVNKHVTADNQDTIWSNEGVELGVEGTVNRRVLSSGLSLTEKEKLLLFKICNDRPVT